MGKFCNKPKIIIQDMQSNRNFEFGTGIHDSLIISTDGRSLHYYNLQNGDGSEFGDYRFYYEKPSIEEYGANFGYADYYARMIENEEVIDKIIYKIKTWLKQENFEVEEFGDLFDYLKED